MDTATQTVELDLTGMTCAACASRIERKLGKLDLVDAAVNYATEQATVTFDPSARSVDELISTVESLGYGAALHADAHPHDEAAAYLNRLYVVAPLAIAVMAISMIPALHFDGWTWVVFALSTPVATWGAWPFHRAALMNLRHGAATMDTLISVGVTAAYLWSVWIMTQPVMHHEEPHLYFEVAVAVVVFMLLGRYYERRSRRRAGSALSALLEAGAKTATVIENIDDVLGREIPADQLQVGQLCAVVPGARIPTDGVVVAGRSSVDNSIMTGESVPIEVSEGDEVIGASINLDGRIVVRATRVGADTSIAQIGKLVARAQTSKAPVQRLADKIAGVFVPVVIAIAVVTLAIWWLVTGEVDRAFEAAVAVLIVACPCALGLATPTALLVGTGRGAQMGIVIKGPEILESTRSIDTIVLDKTGTVTTGHMSVVEVLGADGQPVGETTNGPLDVIAAVEAGSQHPIAQAIVRHAGDRQMASSDNVTLAGSDFVAVAGQGVSAMVDGTVRHVGRLSWLVDSFGSTASAGLREAFDRLTSDGITVVAAAWDGAVQGLVAVADQPKPTSSDAIARFVEMGIRPILLTGDNRAVAERIAAEVGIPDPADNVIADVLPSDKVAVVERLQSDGAVVAVAGDGINDAAALAQADLGIAMGAGADVAIEASDLTLVSGDLTAAVDAIGLSRKTLRVIKGNLFWAFAYNVAAIPLAATGRLSPMIASAAMALSSAFVVTNSLRLRKMRL